jgi:hypothetical protein
MKHPWIMSISFGLALAGLITPAAADTSKDTRADQECLKRFAFYTGPIDGRWGQQSQAALDAWALGALDQSQATKLKQLRSQCAVVSTPAPQKASTPTARASTVQDVSRTTYASSQNSGMTAGGFVLLCLLIAAYFLPAMIASGRHHHQSGAIFALNFFLGWSGLGWIASFVWACTATPSGQASAVPDTKGAL